MNDHARILIRRRTVILVAVGLVATGSVGTYLVMKRSVSAVPATTTSSPSAPVTPPAVGTASSNTPLPDVTVTLSQEAVERAGIEVTPVVGSSESGRIRVPGLVQPNAYRAVVVTPIAGGRITRVLVELGQQVRRGQTLAQAHSPDLAEAQSRYLASRAELDAHERELRRTEKLAEIGAASRQELERVHAEHTAATTMVRSNQSRLTLLGMTEAQVSQLTSASEITSTTNIPAPIDGVITTREANVGLNVDPAMPLFTVVDLSTVWVVGDVYERDLARVRVGSPAMITATAYPEFMVEGKVSYIDPQIKADTRTAQIRVEVPNPGRQLRLGMYTEMQVGDPRQGETSMVPRSAVQMVGDRSVVYLANTSQQGQFVEREVRLGRTMDDMIEIAAGLKPGDSIVSKGSFSLRAERERLGLRSATNPSTTNTPPAPSAQSAQTARVTVSDKGFEPDRVMLRGGVPVRITFVRTSETTCATDVTVPSMNIKRALPLNQPVDVEFTPQKSGDVEFVCGMNMLHGTIVVK